MTGTPTTISEQPQTQANTKPLYKTQGERAGTSKNTPARIPPSIPITPNSQLSGAVDADFFVTA